MASPSTPINPIPNHGEKPERFNGIDFKRWQQKMFYLTTLNLVRFLNEDGPKLDVGETDKEKLAVVDAWNHSDFLCRNYVLNDLENTLYNVYSPLKTAKELWDSLDKKYKTEDAGLKKFIVGKFLDFKMVDSKTVLNQVQELQVVVHDIHAEGMTLSETFQVAAFIEKLPPSWRDFKNYLKHKRKELSLEDFIVRLRIEEDNRLSEKKVGKNLEVSKANVVEEGSKPNKKRKMPSKSREGFNQGLKKFVGKCFNCGKSGHRAKDCKAKKRQKTQANVVEKISNGVDDINLTAMISECNMAGNPKEWWIDTRATRHIFANISMFSSYTTVGGDEKFYMDNSSTSKVEGVGKIALKMTSGMIVTLINVLYVPDVHKNLVSKSLLSKNGFKLVFVSDKFVLSKNDMYVGKGYLSDGLFKLNVMTVVTKDDLNKVASSYVLESSNIWHARLGHVNYKSIKKLMNMGLLPIYYCPSEKCQVCSESKFSKPPFHSVDKRVSEPLDLIHTDICDMKSIPSRGGNKYFITFIDDCRGIVMFTCLVAKMRL